MMTKIESYLHDFLRVFFANQRLIKRIFLIFAVIALLLPLVLKQNFEITAEVIVQSKKLAQTDAQSSLIQETNKFIAPSLTDMETESNILRSSSLIRETIAELQAQGLYDSSTSLIDTWLLAPLKRFVTDPLRTEVINPIRTALGLDIDPIRDTRLDSLIKQASEDLDVQALPGSNVISVVYAYPDPAAGTRFVERLLANYLKSRQTLQSTELPETFYQQKKSQYEQRLDDLENLRLALLENAQASDPKEEITFRLNAINSEERTLSDYQDRALEAQQWLDYLEAHLQTARQTGIDNYSFPFTFANTINNVAYEDREIKQLGEQLNEQISRLNTASATFRSDSLPIREQRGQMERTRTQFLKVVENRIRERASDLAIIKAVIAQKNARIDEYKNRIRALQEVQSKLRQFDTEINALHQAFFTYTQQYEESRSRQFIDDQLSNARILSRPYEPSEPAFPKPMQIIPLGLITALLLAIAMGYVREFFDHRFKYSGQIAEHLNLPVLLIINNVQKQHPIPYKRWSWAWFWAWARH